MVSSGAGARGDDGAPEPPALRWLPGTARAGWRVAPADAQGGGRSRLPRSSARPTAPTGQAREPPLGRVSRRLRPARVSARRSSALRRAIGDPERHVPPARCRRGGARPAPSRSTWRLSSRPCTAGAPEGCAEAAALYQGDLLAGLAVAEPRSRSGCSRSASACASWRGGARALARSSARGRPPRGCRPDRGPARRARPPPGGSAPDAHAAVRELGRRGAALRQYQHASTVLRRELGDEPEAETKQLYQQILRARARRRGRRSSARGAARGARDAHDPIRPSRRRDAADRPRARDGACSAERSTTRGPGEARCDHRGRSGDRKEPTLAELSPRPARGVIHVLLGRCYESEQILPFGPWAEALRAGGMVRDDGRAERARAGLARRAGAALPRAGQPVVCPRRATMPSGCSRASRGCSRPRRRQRPLVLLLEDVHWADDMSLRLLAFVGRRIAGQPVLVAVTAARRRS